MCGNKTHEHVESCIKHNYTLICDKPEHAHTDECLANGIQTTSIEDNAVEEVGEVDTEVEEGGEEDTGWGEEVIEEEQTVYNDGDIIPLLVNVYQPSDETSISFSYVHYGWEPQTGNILSSLDTYDGISTDFLVDEGATYSKVVQGRLNGLGYSCNSGDVNQKLGVLEISVESKLSGTYTCYLRKNSTGYYVEWVNSLDELVSHNSILDLYYIISAVEDVIPDGELPITIDLTVLIDNQIETHQVNYLLSYYDTQVVNTPKNLVNNIDGVGESLPISEEVIDDGSGEVSISQICYGTLYSGNLKLDSLILIHGQDSDVDKKVASISIDVGAGVYNTYDIYLRKDNNGEFHIGYLDTDSGTEMLDTLKVNHICKTKNDFTADEYAIADKILKTLSTEEKVGQLFLCHYPNDGSGTVADAVKIINNYHVGGFIPFAAMFQNSNPTEVKDKISKTQAASKIPLIMSIDEEGGNVTRVSQFPAFRSSKFHSPSEFRTLTNGDYTSNVISNEVAERSIFLRDLGLNLNHAPVADFATSGYMYSRGRVWGVDALSTAGYVANDVYSAEKAGIGSTLKHFPGYGSTSADTHNGFAINHISLNTLWKNDLLPFAAGMNVGGMAVMVTHNIFENIDSENPASLSTNVYSILRDDLGFKGLAITDDLGMGAITTQVGSGKEALAALKAGTDMCILTNIGPNYTAVLNAVNAGELDIEDKVRRILAYKVHEGILTKDNYTESVGTVIYEPKVAEWSEYPSSNNNDVYWSLSKNSDEIYIYNDNTIGCTATSTKEQSKNGSTFVYWEVDGKIVSFDNKYVPNVSDVGKIVYAVYARSLYSSTDDTNYLYLGIGCDVENRVGDYFRFTGSFEDTNTRVKFSGNTYYPFYRAYLHNGKLYGFLNARKQTSHAIYGYHIDISNNGVRQNKTVDLLNDDDFLGDRSNYTLKYWKLQNNDTSGYYGGTVSSKLSTNKLLELLHAQGATAKDFIYEEDGILNINNGYLFMEAMFSVEYPDNVSNKAIIMVDIDSPDYSEEFMTGIYGGKIEYTITNRIVGNIKTNYRCYDYELVDIDNPKSFKNIVFLPNMKKLGSFKGWYDDSGNLVTSDYSVKYEDVKDLLSDGKPLYLHAKISTDGCPEPPSNYVKVVYNTISIYDKVSNSQIYPGKLSREIEYVEKGDSCLGSSIVNLMPDKYILDGWYRNLSYSLVSNEESFIPIANMNDIHNMGYNVYDVYYKIKSDVMLNEPIIGGNKSGGTAKVKNDDTLIANPKEGHIFLGWYLDGELISTKSPFKPKEECPDLDYSKYLTFEARFSDWVGGGAAIHFQASEGGTVVGESVHIVRGDEESFVGPVAAPNSGYSFVGWANQANRIVSRDVRPTVTKPEEGWQNRVYTAVFADITKGSITAQYYAYIDESVISDDSYKVYTNGTNTNEVFSINTLGRRLPKNGTGISTSPNDNKLRTRYVNVDKNSPDYGTLARRRVLQVMYHNQKLSLVGGVLSDAIDSFNNTSYHVKELWVSKDTTDLGSINESDWDIIPYSSDMVFMLINDESNQESRNVVDGNGDAVTDTWYDSENNILYLKDNATVRFVADYINTSTDLPVTFYDYDITDGNRYSSVADAYKQVNPNTTGSYLYSYHSGINDVNNYKGSGSAHLAFGNGNMSTGWGLQKWVGNPSNAVNKLNQANRTPISGSSEHSYRLRTYGLVQGLKDGKIDWSDNVNAPALFDGADAIGKTVLTDYSLHMEGMGNNYTLKSVNGTTLDDLDRLTNTKNGNTTYWNIFSNDFWPADEFPTAGAEGHDPMFGGASKYNIVGASNSTDEKLNGLSGTTPSSDNGKDHNSYFGMQFKFKIRLDANYVGPMNYYFYGDDDMWIFMDDTLIGDIGGIGQSAGLYIDFWDWVDKDKEKIHIHNEKCYNEEAELICGYTDYKEYVLSVYYTERGASGSTCYMSFNVPSFVSVPVQFYGNMKLNKDVVLSDGGNLGNLATQNFPIKIDFKDQLGNTFENGITYTGTKQGTYHSGEELLISHNDDITLLNIPRYTTYTVTEIDPGGFTPSYINQTGEIGWNETSEVTITNTGTSGSKLPDADAFEMPKTGWQGNRFILPWSISAVCGVLLLLLNKKGLLVV